ncbi:HlyD family efflux transporter periplasmic adaptor subunit [Planctomicrobium sp. SH664]|uniref:HlyD family efflux transporter periplasmic adaptor subunit n=1 Tax=Planctomicrobium sp. SH664 TaxID=3448125 RepID=UPI003F5C3163
MEGSTTIISIVPEGTMVKSGEVVCELDSSLLREKAKQQEITFTQAGSTMAQATEALEIQKRQNQSDEAAAQLKLDLARLDLVSFEKGEYPKQEQQLKANLALAKEEELRAKETYAFYSQQVKKGYRTQNDLEAARIAVKQAEYKVQGAQEELEVLQEYTKKRKMAELSANSTEFERELERVRLRGRSTLTQLEKDVEAKKLTYDVEKDRLDKILAQIEACTIRAPQDGEVVYANSSSGGRRSGDTVMIEEGAAVRERQAIINLPDVTQMKVNCRIHESLIGSIRRGLRAKIRIDAYPDEIFNGEISHVSSVPMSGNWPNMDLREYQAEIKLTDDVDRIKRLRPGLTSQVEILVDNRADVLQVPVVAVVNVADRQLAYVEGKNGIERRDVKTGMTNQTHVEILDGISENERVLMSPRRTFATEITQLQAEYNAERNKEDQKAAAATAVPPSAAGEPGAAGPASGRPRAEGARGEGERAGGRGAGGSGGAGGDPAAMFARLDKDGDGKISKDEAPGGMQDRFPQLDKDGDGFLTVEELAAGRQNRPPQAAP